MTTATPTHPFWRVNCIFDPDRTGGDFAYSVGLHERGFPEIHLPARPTDGADPGLDWFFNPHENGELVNDFAEMLLRGDAGPGSRIERTFDGDLTTVVFTFGEPVTPMSVEALHVDAGATVIPIRWSLRRPTEGPPLPLTPTALADLEQQVLAVQRSWCEADLARLPARWRSEAKRDTDPPTRGAADQFGPNGPLLRARSVQLLLLDRVELEILLHTALRAHAGLGATRVLAVASAAARPVGRVAVIGAVHGHARTLRETICSTSRRWREVVRVFAGPDDSRREREHMAGHLGQLLEETLRAVLAADALRDVLDERTVRAALAPLVWALDRGAKAGGAAHALRDPQTWSALLGLFGGGASDQIKHVQESVDRLESHEDGGPVEHAVAKLRAIQTTEPVTPGPAALLSELAAAQPITSLAGAGPRLLDDMGLVAALLSWPHWLAEDELAAVVRELEVALPGLREVVKSARERKPG